MLTQPVKLSLIALASNKFHSFVIPGTNNDRVAGMIYATSVPFIVRSRFILHKRLKTTYASVCALKNFGDYDLLVDTDGAFCVETLSCAGEQDRENFCRRLSTIVEFCVRQ